MDTGGFDMFHDAGHVHVLAVGQGVHVHFDGVLKELVDEDGMFGGVSAHHVAEVFFHVFRAEADLHGAAAEHVAGAHDDGVADAGRGLLGHLKGGAGAVLGLEQVELLEQGLEAFAVFGAVDSVGAGTDDRHTGALERHGEVQRSLAAELHDNTVGLLHVDDMHHVFKGERLEVQAVGGVVVGGHGFGVGVDHDGFHALVAQGEGGMTAAVVELDALTDTVGATAENDDLLLVMHLEFLAGFVGGVEVGGVSLVFTGAGIHQIVGGHGAGGLAEGGHVGFGALPHFGKLAVGEAEFLGLAEQGHEFGVVGRHGVAKGEVAQFAFHGDDVAQFTQEPRVDGGDLVDLFDAHAGEDGVAQGEDLLGVGHTQFAHDLFHGGQFVAEVGTEAGSADFEGAHTLLEGFLEGTADSHGFAHALHGGGELVLGTSELFKGEARNLDDHVVDGGLEAGHRVAGDVVGDFVQRVADSELGAHLGDGEAGGLGGEGGGAGHAGVHFDDHEFAVLRVQAELHVGTAVFHADFTHDGLGGFADHGGLFAGQGLHGGNGDGVAGMDAHGVHIFDGADNDAVVLLVAHNFDFDFLPAEDGLLNEHFAGHGSVKAGLADLFEVFLVVGNATAGTAKGEGGADDEREGEFGGNAAHVVHAAGDFALGHGDADAFHGVTEQFAAFGLFDDFGVSSDELHTAFFEHAHLGEFEGGVEAGLATEGGQNGVGAFLTHDGGDGLGLDGLDIGPVSEAGVRHDGSRVGVDEDDFVAFLFEGFDGLSAGIVKFTGLADDDRARAYDHDALKVCTLRHAFRSWISLNLRIIA